MQPLVSVIIPFFNRAALTAEAIGSALAQTYSAMELIVVNDASTDDVSALVQTFRGDDRIVHVELETNSGPAQARNAGIERAKGDYVAFLDSDDTWEPNKLEIQLAQMKRGRWECSHTSYFRHDTRTGAVKVVPSGKADYAFPRPAFSCRIATPTVVIRRDLLRGLAFRPGLRAGEDVLLWTEVSRREILRGIDIPLATVRVGERTAAFDKAARLEALRLAGQGLAGYPLLRALHAAYRAGRRVQLELLEFWR